MDLKKIQTTAKHAATHVGARIQNVLCGKEEFSVSYKDADDPVTNIDIWAEKEISQIIKSQYPEHIVIGEENSYMSGVKDLDSLAMQANKGPAWVIDPIDGTTNFTKRIPYVGISIGFLLNGIRQVGIVYDPARKEMFSAIAGGGSELNGQKISASNCQGLNKAVIATGLPRDRTKVWHNYTKAYDAIFTTPCDIRRFGASSLDQCWVACGRVDASFEHKLSPWDVAAGSLIVEEAGGIAYNFVEKNEFSIFRDTFIFSSKGIFEELSALLTRESCD